LSSEFKHTVRILKRFERRLKPLDEDTRGRALNTIVELARGEAQGKRLRGPLRDFYTIRVGRYRIIYSIPRPCEIELYTIQHREAVYERLAS